ncbi:hypothetical protein niasHS_016416 [Heterodera schachtii]|uniref:Uncharacterized protein n=1 Tax=Heterodera schachtii TaxID=97005 RepID=A0ABD2HSF4_HETSC
MGRGGGGFLKGLIGADYGQTKARLAKVCRTRWTAAELVLLRRPVAETEGSGSLFGLRRATAIRSAAPEDSRLRTMRNTQVHNQVRYMYRGPHPPPPDF